MIPDHKPDPSPHIIRGTLYLLLFTLIAVAAICGLIALAMLLPTAVVLSGGVLVLALALTGAAS